MKLERIVVDNILGLQHVDLQLNTPITLVAGHNGAGKTSLQQSIRLALTGELSRVKLKKDLDQLVHNGQKKGAAAVTSDAAEYRYDLPSGKGSHVSNFVLPYVLDPALFARTDAQERRRFLFELAGVKVSTDEVRRRLLAAGCDVKRCEAVLPLLRAGFPEAQKDAARRATESKGGWRAVTGETYGEKKADGWQADIPPHDAMALVEARSKLSKIDTDLDASNQQLGALEQQQSNAAKQEQRVAFLEKHVADLDRHTDLVMRSKKELDEFRPNFEAVVQAAHPIDPLTCPHCAGAIMLGDDNQLIAYEPPPERDEGAASVEEYERALGVLERTLANRQRDLQQSKDAKVELDALLAQCPEVDQGQIEKLRGAVHALREQREVQRTEVEQLDQAIRAAKAAQGVTEKAAEHHADVQAWGRIATALAPDGIPGDLLTEALQPFNERLRLSSADTGWRAPFITADMEILADNRPYGLLSESEQWRCDAMIAEAIAYLSKLHLLMLDRFDVLDMQGRGELMGWLMVLADEGEIDTALLFGTLKSLPAIQPDVVSSHWLENGSIQQQQAEKAA